MNRKISIVTQKTALPDGVVPGAFRFVVDGTQVQDVSPATEPRAEGVPVAQASFVLAAGNHSVTVQRLDVNGNPFGPAASQSFTVDQDTFDAPVSITVDAA